MAIWHSFGVMIGHGVDFHVKTAAGRLLTVGLYIMSLVLVATYVANLTSYLTVVKTTELVSSINDIKNGKIPFNRIGVRIGSSIEEYYLQEISNNVVNFYPLTSSQQQYDSLLSGIIDVGFMDIGEAEYITNNVYCNLTLIGADFDSSSFGIVIPKQWIYEQILDVNILSLRESGELDSLRAKWFQAKTCQDGSNGPRAIGMESLGGLFLTFGVISILSILLFIWHSRYLTENYIFNLFRRRNIPPQRDIPMAPYLTKINTDSPDPQLH